MSDASQERDGRTALMRPRPVRMPSRFAQAALLVLGVTALFLFVMQLTAPSSNGLINGRGASFDGHSAVAQRSLR